MSEMVERVAAAINSAAHDGIEAQARAAIAAMREPTEDMREAGEEELDDGDTYMCLVRAGEVYTAMIDAALKEET